MARKKRRKEKAEPAWQAGDWSSPNRGPAKQSEEPEEIVPPRKLSSGENHTVEAFAARDTKGKELSPPPERELRSGGSPEPAGEPAGFLARISRWFQGESEPAYSPPPPAPPPEPRRVQASEPERRAPEPEPPPPPAAHREPPSPSAWRPSASEQTGGVPPSKVDHILAVLTLERVLPELDAARKQVEEMRVSSDQRIRQLEAERDELRAEVERVRAGKSDIASSESQLQELDEARGRIRQLEAERDQSRSETDRARAAQDELNHRVRQLEAALQAQQADRSSEEVAGLEGRVRALEEELNAARSHAEREMEEAKARIGQLESERKEIEANMAAKEKKLMVSLGQIEEVHEQARRLEEEMARLRSVESERDQLSTQLAAKEEELITTAKLSARVPVLEAELTAWKNRATTQTTGRTAAPQEAAPSAQGNQSAGLADLYQQTISRLTVIQASAELLAMNSRLDASSRDTAKDIRSESQLLSEIIKNFALPSDRRKAE